MCYSVRATPHILLESADTRACVLQTDAVWHQIVGPNERWWAKGVTMEISSSPPLNTSPLLMSGFQLKVTLLKKGDVMLLWSDTVALMFLFCQAVTKTKVASVCPGVVQSCIAPSPRNYQMSSNKQPPWLCSCLCVSLKPNPTFSVVCPPHTQSLADSGPAYRWVPFAQ